MENGGEEYASRKRHTVPCGRWDEPPGENEEGTVLFSREMRDPIVTYALMGIQIKVARHGLKFTLRLM